MPNSNNTNEKKKMKKSCNKERWMGETQKENQTWLTRIWKNKTENKIKTN